MRLATLIEALGPGLNEAEGESLSLLLAQASEELAGFDPTAVPPQQLAAELEALVALYRAVRSADERMQSMLRASEVADALTAIYYRLRSVQGGLTMAFAAAPSEVPRPEMSPLGTAIGLFDAPKVLAQPTHLRSGSYDTALAWFARWMQEIWTDMRVRHADYVRFYGEVEVVEARATLRSMLGLDEAGQPGLLEVLSDGAEDPVLLRRQLAAHASDGADLVDAAHAIQVAGDEARLRLLSLLAHEDSYLAAFGAKVVEAARASLAYVLSWRFPVEPLPAVDGAAEQEQLDRLLEEIGIGPVSEGDVPRIEASLRRACAVEQALRDRAAGQPSMERLRRQSLRWYVWELLELLDRARPPKTLGGK